MINKNEFSILLLFILFSHLLFSQEENEIEKLKKYNSYEHIISPKSKFKWTHKYELNKGLHSKEEIYNSKELTFRQKFIYDSINKLKYSVVMYNINDGIISDTLIETESKKYVYPLIEKKYDSYNNIIEEKIYKKTDSLNNGKEVFEIESILYKYDKLNNIIELNRSFNIPMEFPIVYGDGRAHYQNEKIRYIYNKDGLWIKKYWTVNEKEFLIEKRKFYKK